MWHILFSAYFLRSPFYISKFIEHFTLNFTAKRLISINIHQWSFKSKKIWAQKANNFLGSRIVTWTWFMASSHWKISCRCSSCLLWSSVRLVPSVTFLLEKQLIFLSWFVLSKRLDYCKSLLLVALHIIHITLKSADPCCLL